MKAKDAIPQETKTVVIYRFPCEECNSKYVGETGKTLKTRVTRHNTVVRNRLVYSLIDLYFLNTDHQFVFGEAQIIGRAQSKKGRLLIEAIYADKNTINGHILLDLCCKLIKDRLTYLFTI